MNTYPSLINIRSYLSEQFFALRTNAVRASFWAKLIGTNTSLAIFPEQAPQKSPNRRYLGTQDVLVEQINGTLNRQNDFDHKFRPLKKYLRDRWVNVHLALEKDGWPAIIVHKVGENYYVEDGHHRVSVARSLGIAYIQAKVWEYPLREEPARKARTRKSPGRDRVKVFSAQKYFEISR